MSAATSSITTRFTPTKPRMNAFYAIIGVLFATSIVSLDVCVVGNNTKAGVVAVAAIALAVVVAFAGVAVLAATRNR